MRTRAQGRETVFDSAPGELFVVRNVAALVPVYAPDSLPHAASAALEYAVLALAVRHIMVMGHGRCGGVAAALEDRSPLTATDFVGSWVAPLRDLAMELDPTDWSDPALMQRDLEFRSIEQSVLNLKMFPWIRSRVRAWDARGRRLLVRHLAGRAVGPCARRVDARAAC